MAPAASADPTATDAPADPDPEDDDEVEATATEEHEEEAEEEPTEAVATPTVISSTGSTIDIVYWGSFSGANGEAEQEVVRLFNESQQDVRVEYQFQGSYEETAQKLTAGLAARQTPDVSLLSDVWWFRFYINNALAPLNDFISAHNVDTSDYVDSLFEEGVRDDTVFWLPMARSTPLFFYNKEHWEAAGLPDRGPENWTEMTEWAQELVIRDGNTVTRSAFAHPGAASYIAWLFQGVIWQYGGKYSDPDFTIRIAEEAGVEAGEFYRSTVADGWATTPIDLNLEFTNELTSSMMASTAGLGGLTRTAEFEIGTAFLPEGPAGFGCCTGGAGLSVLANVSPERQEAGFRFIEFATSPEITTLWSQATGYMPVRKSAIDGPEMEAFYQENPNFRTVVEQLPYTTPQDAARVFIPGGDQIIGEGLERITISNEPAEGAFQNVARILEDEAQPIIEAVEALG
jgi:sn-glycerol 3-phosphate transport system substrate-binding protein